MPIADQLLTDRYALYCGDAMEVLPTLPAGSIHLSIYSPPFATEGGGALYHYSSSPRDLSNARTYQEFWRHYAFILRELFRVTMPGRETCVHCTDIPSGNTGNDWLVDFPGQIIRAHNKAGWRHVARYHAWKEPLAVRNRTMTKALAHQQIVNDSSRCTVASADYLLVFRRKGVNPVPITHPQGLMEYAGEREIPKELLSYRGWKGKQTENLYSHWIWRQYASSFWDDVRVDRVLPFKPARDEQDEKHVHPLQRDVIERLLHLWSNPGEVVADPFAGVGSTVYEAVRLGRRGIGVELKPSYFRQMVKNVAAAESEAARGTEQLTIEALA
jgi:DNA modification methylase